MLKSILIGIVLAVATIAIHATGTSSLIQALRHRENQFRGKLGQFKVLSIAAASLLLLHTAEVLLWALIYLLLDESPSITSLEDAGYFSAVTFTSLGYGDIVLQGRWRLLSAFQAMTGLLVYGWSSALLFAIVQRIWQLQSVAEDSNPASPDRKS